MPRLEELQEAIAGLSRAEREKLAATLAYENRGAQSSQLTHEERFVLGCVLKISDCASGIRVPQDQFLRAYGMRKFRERVADIYNFVRETRRYLRPIQVEGLITTCFRCLASELQGRGTEVTPRMLLDRQALITCALDRRFPGYVAAGHLHRIVGAAVDERERVPA